MIVIIPMKEYNRLKTRQRISTRFGYPNDKYVQHGFVWNWLKSNVLPRLLLDSALCQKERLLIYSFRFLTGGDGYWLYFLICHVVQMLKWWCFPTITTMHMYTHALAYTFASLGLFTSVSSTLKYSHLLYIVFSAINITYQMSFIWKSYDALCNMKLCHKEIKAFFFFSLFFTFPSFYFLPFYSFSLSNTNNPKSPYHCIMVTFIPTAFIVRHGERLGNI